MEQVAVSVVTFLVIALVGLWVYDRPARKVLKIVKLWSRLQEWAETGYRTTWWWEDRVPAIEADREEDKIYSLIILLPEILKHKLLNLPIMQDVATLRKRTDRLSNVLALGNELRWRAGGPGPHSKDLMALGYAELAQKLSSAQRCLLPKEQERLQDFARPKDIEDWCKTCARQLVYGLAIKLLSPLPYHNFLEVAKSLKHELESSGMTSEDLSLNHKEGVKIMQHFLKLSDDEVAQWLSLPPDKAETPAT